jgi:hypothetical protein
MRPSASRLGSDEVEVVGAIARNCSKGRAAEACATAVCAAACAEAASAAWLPPSKSTASFATLLRPVAIW